jgi:predicted nucleic acid-binding protein
MIYLDACLVIYWVEGHTVFRPKLELCALQVAPAPFAISPLVMAESMVMPYRHNNLPLICKFEAFFANVLMLPMPEAVFLEAARLWADHPGLKTPDALHLAYARLHGCASFWTHDDRLSRMIGSFAVNVLGSKS